MSLFRIIPGVLWLDVLDTITDRCQTFLGWRLPCSLIVLFAWMSFLGEARVQAVNAVKYITVVYYRPNKTAIHKIFGHWQARLAMCAVACGLSYYFTFEFEEDFPYLQELKEKIRNERSQQKIEEIEEREVFLMAHVFVQRFLQQAQAIVWVLGTFLRLKRKRFYKLVALVLVIKPLGSTLVGWCGNYALWLFIGHTLLRAFDLAPQGYPRLGTAGSYTAVLVSTIFWRKYGTSEIILAIAAAIGGEIAWRRAYYSAVKQVQDEKARRAEHKPGIADRVFGFFADFVVPEEEEPTEVKPKIATTKKDDDKAEEENLEVAEAVAYTRPSLYSWLAIVVYWAAIGIHVDGYDIGVL